MEVSGLKIGVHYIYHIQKNIIYFNVDGGYNYATKQRSIEHKEYTDQMLKGFLIHEMHHAWENFKHQNNCDPYAATSDKSQMKDLMEEANKANRTVSLNSTNPITLPSGIFNIFHYPEEQHHLELVVRTSHAIAALTGMKDQKSDETISEDEAKKKIQTLFPKSFSFFETELEQMKEWNSKIEERLKNTNSAPLLESKKTEEESTLDKINPFADQTITSPDDAAIGTSLNMDDADLMKGIKTQENNPNPDSSYRGIGIKVTVENEGLKMVDIFSPNVKRFKVLNQKSSGSFVDSDDLLPSIGEYITTN